MSKVSKGFLWSAIDQLSVQIIQFVLSIIIARLVSPSAFGVVVMVQVFISFAQLFIDGGFKSALIQKRDRTEVDFHTVFYLNMVVAILLYIAMYLSAPYIAKFYNEPVLTNLTRVISLNLIFGSFSMTQLVKLQILLDFKTQAKARVVSMILSGFIGIYCAYIGWEAWALVIQSVTGTFITSLLLMFLSHWKPKLLFSFDSFKKLFSFGSKVLFNNFLTNFYIQITNVVIGKYYSSSQLAYYNRGFNIAQLPSVNIMEVMGRTIYPIYCELQSNKDELDRSFRKYLRLSCFFIFPIMSIIYILAKPLIIVLLTESWVETAPLLSIFCLSFLPYPFLYNCGNYSLALGFAGLNAKTAVVKRIVSFALLIVALPISVTAIAYSILLSNVFEMFVNLWVAKKAGNITILRQLSFVYDIILLSLLTTVFVSITKTLFYNELFQLIIGCIVGFVVLVLGTFVLKMDEKELFISLLRLKKTKSDNDYRNKMN